ncbi:hypothetical protein GJ744_008824 [Endocarpon pusillum]|uniref:Uncharacterized protein n=1 Tax=Endocarpon pusillum TaxID=364733 RepID=A0A8H7AYM6_9EURO|nr:hypothetical protein GJ744_008824 [Endocarpon pusillum]
MGINILSLERSATDRGRAGKPRHGTGCVREGVKERKRRRWDGQFAPNTLFGLETVMKRVYEV